MWEILQGLSDNQVALLGCLVALGGAMLTLTVSFYSRSENYSETLTTFSAQNDDQEAQQSRRAA